MIITFGIIFGYFFIGWIWATLVVYFHWRCDDETYTDFTFSFLAWPLDIIRRIFMGIGNVLGYYEGWLNRSRLGNGEKPLPRNSRIVKF